MGIHDMGDAWAPEEEDAERGLSGTSRTSGRVRRTRILDDREYDVSYCPRVAIDKSELPTLRSASHGDSVEE
jgi:hypothetical protein